MSWLRAWWAGFRAKWVAARNPFDVDTAFEDSAPETVWPESAPDVLSDPRPEQVK